jgi:predicted nucleotidyltransferase
MNLGKETETINEIIQQKLTEIEEKEDVKILHCVESGSRAWGFASPDSDYDVRFIYVRKHDFYLKLEKTRDVIEWQLDETLDINGWDLQKALRLLLKSNPTLFEWNSSPIVYKTTDEWSLVKEIINDYFLAKSGIYHYISTAKTNYREYLKGEMVRLKKYFYVLRPILACKWIIDKNTPPPMLFSELMETELEAEMIPVVNDLLDLKMNTPEVGEGKRIDKLNDYIDFQLSEIQHKIDSMSNEREADWQKLNDVFLRLVEW